MKWLQPSLVVALFIAGLFSNPALSGERLAPSQAPRNKNGERLAPPQNKTLKLELIDVFKFSGQDGVLDLGADYDEPYAVAIDASGRAVVAGRSGGKFAVARFKGDGGLDTDFGSAGKVITPFAVNDNGFDAVTIDDNGKILAAGSALMNGKARFALVRYLDTGELDPSFGDNGKVTTEFAGKAFASDVAVQPDGKIVVVGTVYNPSLRKFGLARYETNGDLDAAFGTGGVVVTSLGSLDDIPSSVALQSGKIVVAGSSQVSVGPLDFDFAVARYNADGSLDTATFGEGKGFATTAMAGIDHGTSLVLQSNGKILVGGRAASKFGLVRYQENGALDPDFDSDGKVMTTIGTDTASITNIFILPDGKILAAGRSGFADFAMARYLSYGSMESSYSGLNSNSEPTTWNGKTFNVTAAALQSDKKLVVVGILENPNGKDFALARFGEDGGNLADTVDLTVSAWTASPNPVVKNNNLVLNLTVKNNGTVSATNVAAAYSLPSNVSFVSAPNCTGTTTVTCNLGAVASGQTKTKQITVKPTKKKNGQIHTVDVATTDADQNPADNTKSVTVNVTD